MTMPQHEHTTRREIPNFRRINDRLFAGGQPRGDDLAHLKDLGVRTILDLRGSGNIAKGLEARAARALGLRYFRIPMGHWVAPGEAAIERALEILADPSQGPVYVHCRRGCDRTGTVIACYRIAIEGWDAESAIDEARRRGMLASEFPKRSFIRRFSRRHAERTRMAATHEVPS